MQVHTVTGGGGIRLHVEETGPRDGRPILFIHGFSQCRLAWTKQLHSDLADDFRLVAMDIRGHGLSDKPRDAYGDSQLWAEDVQAVIDALGLDHPILSGWSYGVILCDYLRCYGEERIGGINFVSAATKFGSEAALAVLGAEFLSLVPGFFATDAEESVRSLEHFLHHLVMHEEPSPADLYFFLGYNVIVPPYVRQGLFSRALDNDDLLRQLRKPVLITHGEQDVVLLPTAAEQHAASIRHAQLSLYPNVGHAPFWEDAPRFNRELRAFADAVEH